MCIAISASNLVSLADSLIPKLVFIRRGEYSLCNPRHPDTSWSRFERENEIPWRPCSPHRICSCLSNHLDHAFATLDCRNSTHHHGPPMIFLSSIALDLESAASFGIKIGISWHTRATIIRALLRMITEYRSAIAANPEQLLASTIGCSPTSSDALTSGSKSHSTSFRSGLLTSQANHWRYWDDDSISSCCHLPLVCLTRQLPSLTCRHQHYLLIRCPFRDDDCWQVKQTSGSTEMTIRICITSINEIAVRSQSSIHTSLLQADSQIGDRNEERAWTSRFGRCDQMFERVILF